MYFDEGDAHGSQGITQGNAGMRESGRIDQDETGAIGARCLYAVHQFVFGIGLEGFQLMSDLSRALAKAAIDLFQRGAAIDTRLAFAEQVQIGTVYKRRAPMAPVLF